MHSGDFCPNGHQLGREPPMVGVQAWCAMLLFLLMKLVPRESLEYSRAWRQYMRRS
jgi:hypothetical protein